MTWDIFCTVIDNFGDIGVTWRLARQLAAEHGVGVRLWVDDLHAFQHLRPEIDASLPIQHLAGVEIRHWTTPLADAEPGEVVIEALACNLPDAFVARMAAKQAAPVWLNLEYLSAEDWVAGVHGLPSPHPRLPLTKHFFMPGYTPNTGGLTREAWLTAERDAFQTKAIPTDALRVSLFSYENAALPGLLQAWAAGDRPVEVRVPVGKALPAIAAWFGEATGLPGMTWQRDALTLHVLPMLDQDSYDRLLWESDLNFVRGEDSCLRAQFAARPMVWQAYVQAEDAHFAKLDALLALYCADMDAPLAELTRTFWQTWNHQGEMRLLWPQWLAALPALSAHARSWDTKLAAQPDLATNLLKSCRKWLK